MPLDEQDYTEDYTEIVTIHFMNASTVKARFTQSQRATLLSDFQMMKVTGVYPCLAIDPHPSAPPVKKALALRFADVHYIY
jgi:hypothetical protein